MLKLAKTALLSSALLTLVANPAVARGVVERAVDCANAGGKVVDNQCVVPPKPAETPNANGGPRTGAPQGRGQQAAPQPQATQPQITQQQGGGRGGPQNGQGGNPQQGNPQQGNSQQGGRGVAQQENSAPQNSQQGGGRGVVQQQGGAPQNAPQQDRAQGNNQRDNRQFGNDRNDQRDNRQFGNDRNDQRDNRQFGNDRNNNFGQRDFRQYGYDRNNFDRDAFNRRYYGRYGNDPNNFQRDRVRYRATQHWRENYAHDYVYADDSFYRDCQSNNEVGGAIIGAILGGILGNSLSNGQGGATLAGLILGGAGGAAIASNLDCEDRSYVYSTYYDGFERGRPNASYPWRNDRSGHYGTFVVGDYYRDRDDYRCATYSQTIYVRGTPQVARGHACRQQDGTWAIID